MFGALPSRNACGRRSRKCPPARRCPMPNLRGVSVRRSPSAPWQGRVPRTSSPSPFPAIVWFATMAHSPAMLGASSASALSSIARPHKGVIPEAARKWVDFYTWARPDDPGSGVPDGRLHPGLDHLAELSPDLAHNLGQLAQQLLRVLPPRQRRAGPDLAGDPRQRQHDQVRMDLTLLQQPHDRPLEPLHGGPEL